MVLIDNIGNGIKDLIERHGLPFVFLGGVIEEIIVPIPSPIVMVTGGLVLLGDKPITLETLGLFLLISFAGALGQTLGSLVIFSVGYFGGKPVVEKTKGWTGVSWEEIEKIEKQFKRGYKDEVVIAGLRAVPFIPVSIVAASCGLIRVPFKSFIIGSIPGSMIRCAIFAAFGWFAYDYFINVVDGLFDSIEKIVLVVFVIAVSIFLYKKVQSRIMK